MPRSASEKRSATALILLLTRSAMTALYFDPLRAGSTPFCTRKTVASLPRLASPWTSSAKYCESALSKGSRDSISRYFAIAASCDESLIGREVSLLYQDVYQDARES